MVNICNDLPPPRRLLLNLLDSADGGILTAGQAVAAGALFGIPETSVRVALTRLARGRLVEAGERGIYRLGDAARALGEEVAGWREAGARTSSWSGGWTACFMPRPLRRERSTARIADRALSIAGFRALADGLFVRPDNLLGGATALRERLVRLGLGEAGDGRALVATLSDLDAADAARAASLWREEGLSTSYRVWTERLRDWLAQAGRLTHEDAARESFLLGDAAIRHILFDPLLPAPLVDEDARTAMIAETIRFDAFGKGVWSDFLGR